MGSHFGFAVLAVQSVGQWNIGLRRFSDIFWMGSELEENLFKENI